MANLRHIGTGNKLLKSVLSKGGSKVKEITAQNTQTKKKNDNPPSPSKFSARSK